MKLLDDWKKKRKMKKESLTHVFKLAQMPNKNTCFLDLQLVSREYQMKWYKHRINRIAKALRMHAMFSSENDKVVLLCQDYRSALLLGGCFCEDTDELSKRISEINK